MTKTMDRVAITLALTALALAALPLAISPAAATPNFGVRAGVTLDPDQVHLGAHARVAELSPSLAFVPNVEIGFGSDATVYAFNGELVYTAESPSWRGWRPYFGGGIGLVIVKYDWPEIVAPADGVERDDSTEDIGATLLIGTRKLLNLGHEFFGELKLGLEDQPDLKVTVGLTFF